MLFSSLGPSHQTLIVGEDCAVMVMRDSSLFLMVPLHILGLQLILYLVPNSATGVLTGISTVECLLSRLLLVVFPFKTCFKLLSSVFGKQSWLLRRLMWIWPHGGSTSTWNHFTWVSMTGSLSEQFPVRYLQWQKITILSRKQRLFYTQGRTKPVHAYKWQWKWKRSLTGNVVLFICIWFRAVDCFDKCSW